MEGWMQRRQESIVYCNLHANVLATTCRDVVVATASIVLRACLARCTLLAQVVWSTHQSRRGSNTYLECKMCAGFKCKNAREKDVWTSMYGTCPKHAQWMYQDLGHFSRTKKQPGGCYGKLLKDYMLVCRSKWWMPAKWHSVKWVQWSINNETS